MCIIKIYEVLRQTVKTQQYPLKGVGIVGDCDKGRLTFYFTYIFV